MEKKRCKGAVASEPHVSPLTRVREYYSNEFLGVVSGKLFCNACRETISVKKSVIVWHVKSAKHAAGKKHIDSKEKRERNIAEMLQAYDKKVHPSGETLPECVCVHRVKVVTAFLKAGVPLNRLDCFHEIFGRECI